MNVPVLPGTLNDNPSLDRWVAFPAPGKVTINTGRVEIGQGVLTAMAQIAADELDVDMARITIKSGDTLSGIVAATGVSLAEIQALNPGIDSNSLSVGQKVKLPPE